jgi:hypothetical protein
MEGKPGNKITNYLTKFYMKYTNTISLNKNLLLSGSVGFIVSLIVAYVSTKYSNDDFVISALTVIAGFISSKDILKQIVTKMIFADAIFDIINNVSRFFILLELLRIEYQPVQAATIAAIIASCLSYLAINLIVRRIHVFRFRKKIF